MIRVETIRSQDAPRGVLTEVRALLDLAFDGELSDEDWVHTIGGSHVLVREDDVLVAHAAMVARDLHVDDRTVRTGYVEGVATLPSRQGEGLGSMAMARLAEDIRAEHEMGALSTGLHRFYERLGWERWRGPTFVRIGEQLVRTTEDDDGIMVLRFGPSRATRLDARLSCEHRAGDAW